MNLRPPISGDRRRRVGALLIVLAAFGVSPGPSAAASLSGAASSLAAASPSAAASSYAFDLYRPGVYTMQATWWFCTAASVQVMRNINRDETDHAAASQQRFFDYMRARNRYRMPATDGIDPKGFLAGVQAFVDARYQLVASTTFNNAVRSAVMRLRASRLPVAVIVDRGRHAWVLTGFTATADPARSAGFRLLSVRIVGPLFGRQSLNGYDPPPDTRLTVDMFRRFLTPYSFKYGPTPWDDRFVTFQVTG
jgi:hypothetical protein